MDEFQGWDSVETNFLRVPLQMIEMLPEFTKLATLKVTIYTIRHTWGYGDDDFKKITLDEFVNGRKRRDGSRIDNGCGMTVKSIRAGIEDAVNMGILDVEKDDSDKARAEHFYRLVKSNSQDEIGLVKSNSQEVKSNNPRLVKSINQQVESINRTEINTNRSITKIDPIDRSSSLPSGDDSRPPTTEDDDDDLLTLFKDKILQRPTATDLERIQAIRAQYGDHKFRDAVTRAGGKGRSVAYVEAILENDTEQASKPKQRHRPPPQRGTTSQNSILDDPKYAGMIVG